jgi:hypothetical protein
MTSTAGDAASARAERRAARVAAGAAELSHRLTDALRAGLASPAPWPEFAPRMVDAQAPGLAARVRELEALPVAAPGGPGRLLEEYALLHLLAAAYGRSDTLPEALAATVRRHVGFTVDTATVLAGPRLSDVWSVLGVLDAPEGRLTSRRVWLRGTATGRLALLLSFTAPGTAPEPAPAAGSLLRAELAYYPGAPALRAALAEGAAEAVPDPGPPPGGGVADAVAAYGAALAEDPWLEAWPVVLSGVVPIPGEGGWLITDAQAAVPVDRRAAGAGLWRLAALSGGRPLTVFGTYGHLGFLPVTAWGDGPAGVDVSR